MNYGSSESLTLQLRLDLGDIYSNPMILIRF